MKYDATLLHLALLQRSEDQELGPSLTAFTESSGRCLEVSRASIWLYGEQKRWLRCLDLYEIARDRHLNGTTLEANQFPLYFAELAEERCMAVDDARTDPRTAEFTGGYLEENEICSVLDAPIFLSGRCVGVFCAEQTQRTRRWNAEEKVFCASVADLISLAIGAHEREAALVKLRQSEELYRSLVEDQTDFLLRSRADGTITFANPAVCTFLEAELGPLIGRTVYDFMPEEDRPILATATAALTTEQPTVTYEHRVFDPGGPPRLIQWTLRALFDQNGALREYQAVGRDISREREHEQRMAEAQRLEALAVLAGGIAHDFNNLLTPMIGFAESVIAELPVGADQRERLEQIVRAGERAAQLVRQILIFGRKDKGQRRLVDAAPLLRETVGFLRSSLPSRIELEVSIASDLGAVLAQPSDLYQILSNLCTNAYQAMPAGGRLTIEASSIAPHAPGGPRELQLSVSDTGGGIDPALRERIFEPFFTTKAPGQGTGLGLSVVHGTVTGLGGRLSVQSTPGKGTRFVIWLPNRPRTVSVAPSENGPSRTPAAHVLVADDEPAVVELLTHSLGRLGHTVVACASASELLIAFERAPASFDLVITDLTMPHMSGTELAFQIHRTRRDLPVVLCTGFGELLAPDDLTAAGVVELLEKPFSFEALATRVHAALETKLEDPA